MALVLAPSSCPNIALWFSFFFSEVAGLTWFLGHVQYYFIIFYLFSGLLVPQSGFVALIAFLAFVASWLRWLLRLFGFCDYMNFIVWSTPLWFLWRLWRLWLLWLLSSRLLSFLFLFFILLFLVSCSFGFRGFLGSMLQLSCRQRVTHQWELIKHIWYNIIRHVL